MSILSAKNIVVSYYGDISVLRDVSMEAKEGEITIIIGPNGAGKSTLLKTLYGLLRPKKGSIIYEGKDITGLKVHEFMKLGLAYVPQSRTVFPDLTVMENLELGSWILRHDKKKVNEALDYVFSFFPILDEKKNDKAKTLSGGQQKMLEVGRALLTKPKVLLLDEPTATLAPMLAKEIYSFLVRLRDEKTTIVLVDQNVRQAFEIANYIYVLELEENSTQGSKKEFEGKLKEVIKDWLNYDESH